MAHILRALEGIGLIAHELLTRLLESHDDFCVDYLQRTCSGTSDPTRRLLEGCQAEPAGQVAISSPQTYTTL